MNYLNTENIIVAQCTAEGYGAINIIRISGASLEGLYGKIVKEIEILKKPNEGKKLILTIDSRLQYVAYRELKKQINNDCWVTRSNNE